MSGVSLVCVPALDDHPLYDREVFQLYTEGQLQGAKCPNPAQSDAAEEQALGAGPPPSAYERALLECLCVNDPAVVAAIDELLGPELIDDRVAELLGKFGRWKNGTGSFRKRVAAVVRDTL